MLGRMSKQLETANASTFPQNMERLLHGHFAGNVAALARFLAVNRYSVLTWKGGVHRPTLLSLADLSLRVNVPMADLLDKAHNRVQIDARDSLNCPDAGPFIEHGNHRRFLLGFQVVCHSRFNC